MDALRRRRLIQWQPLEGLLSVLSGGTSSPEAELVQKERQAEIEQVLAQLPPRYRMVLLLREREGLSYNEIAEVTGDSLDTVKVTLYRARERARKIARKIGDKLHDSRTRSEKL
jgi:RNA polymerase sigma-70 factor (ECF subfamily)